MEQSVDFSVLRIIADTSRLEVCRHVVVVILSAQQLACSSIPLAHGKELLVGGGLVVARHDCQHLSVNIACARVANHKVKVVGPHCLLVVGDSAALIEVGLVHSRVFLRFGKL